MISISLKWYSIKIHLFLAACAWHEGVCYSWAEIWVSIWNFISDTTTDDDDVDGIWYEMKEEMQ